MLTKKEKWIFAAIIALHLLFVIVSIRQPFQGDEVVFPACAKGLLETGRPVFDFSALNPGYNCLWHPPLYINMMAASIDLFGDNNYSIRGVSALFNFLSVFLVFFIVKEIFKDKESKNSIAILAAALYALNPLVIQASISVDIDSGILNFSVLLFMLAFVKSKSFYYLIPALFLVFWAKFAGPILLAGTLFFYHVLRKDWKGLIRTISLFLITGAIFLLSFWIYSRMFDVNLFMTFIHNFAGRGSGFLSYLGLLKGAWAFKSYFYFAIPFLIILFFILLFFFYKEAVKKRVFDDSERKLFLFSLYAFIAIAFYTYQMGTSWLFPKYFIASMASLCIFVFGFIFKNSDKNIDSLLTSFRDNRKLILKVFVFSLFLILYFAAIVGNPLVPEFDETKENANVWQAGKLIGISFTLYAIIPFAAALLVFGTSKKKIVWSLLLLVFLISFYININHLFANYATYSRYGDYGTQEVIDYFKDNNIPAKNVSTYLNFGYYMGLSNYTDISYVFNQPDKFKKYVIDNPDVTYLIIFHRDIKRLGDNLSYFKLEKQIGSYYVYKKIS